jgi:hypothetical protein
MEDDTPRSIGYGSPRDDRFYTPRAFIRSNSNSNSDEWITPRQQNVYNSDGEFQTPRTIAEFAEKKSGGLRSSIMYNSEEKQYSHQIAPGKSHKHNPYTYKASQIYNHKDEPVEEGEEEDPNPGYDAAKISKKDIEDIFSFTRHGRCEEIEKLLNKGVPVDIRVLLIHLIFYFIFILFFLKK